MPSNEISNKTLKSLTMEESYDRIYSWHIKNKQRIHDNLAHKKEDDPYIICYQKLVRALPHPAEVTREDVAFVCREVIAGLMEWAYHEKDENGVKMSTYAHYVLGTFFDGFNGKETRKFSQNSKLYEDYSMRKCLAGIKSTILLDKYFEELLRISDSGKVRDVIELLLRDSIGNIENVVDVAVDKIKENGYDGSKWSTLAFSISASFGKHVEASKILEELVKKEPENPAYHNNLGVNYTYRELYGSALKSFAIAYAIDSKFRGIKKASKLPAWRNLSQLCDSIDKIRIRHRKK